MKNQHMRSYERGATLVEAVAALFIFSVGILGVAALQATTLVRGDDVKQRSLAIWKAQELADRIRATTSIANPAGLSADYINVIGGDIGPILSYADEDNFQCPNAAPTRCDDLNGTPANSCTTDEMVEFDVWSVICDPVTGASDEVIGNQDGVNKLKGLDIAMRRDAATGESFLYFSWISRAADRNESLQDAAGNTVSALLCGDDVQVDSRLDTYCLRFF